MTKSKPYKCSHALEQQLLRWALSGNTGKSSMYMAGVAAFGRGYRPSHSALPGDYDDLRRCVHMAAACKSFRQALPELASVSPLWSRFVARWDELVRLAEQQERGLYRVHAVYRQIVEKLHNTTI
jgi:hypothetical protein